MTQKQRQAASRFKKLRKLADKAYFARQEFDRLFEYTKEGEPELWADICREFGMDPDSDSGDWMC